VASAWGSQKVMKTVQILGLRLSPVLLLRADEVIK
jgi:hypothetical protein